MKYTTRIIVAMGLVVSLILTIALTGCSSSSSYNAPAASSSAASYDALMMDMAMPEAAPAPALDGSNGEAGFAGKRQAGAGKEVASTAAPVDQPRKLIKNSQLSLETKEFETALDSLTKLVEGTGGYVENQSVDGISLRNQRDYYERSARIVARIPADKLDSFTTQAGELCNIVSHSEGVSDITDSYYDVQSRIDVLLVKETRLTELLAKAEKLEDIIQLEDALSNCQYELDNMTGQLRRMDSQVNYSTCSIDLNEVVEYSDVQAAPLTFGERLGDSLRYSWRNLSGSVQNTIIGLIESGPVALFYLLLWGGVIYLVYRFVFRKRMRERSVARTAAPSITETAPTEDSTPPTAE